MTSPSARPGTPFSPTAGVRRPSSLIFLHWFTVVLIAAVLGVVFVREGIDEKALRTALINLHRSLGLCVALLAVARIAVRLARRPLPPTADASPLEHFVAMAVRLKYYFAWTISETISNISGLGFSGIDKDGKPQWTLMNNIDIWAFEVCSLSPL